MYLRNILVIAFLGAHHIYKEEKTMAGTGIKIVAGVLIGACLAGSVGMGAYQIVTNNKNANTVNAFIDGQLRYQEEKEKKENEYIEDGFVVGDSYEIKSTKEISDAYISGDESKLSEEDKNTLKLAKKVLKDVKIDKCKTNYEKEKAIYDWLVTNVGHGNSTFITMPGAGSNAFTPNGVLNGNGAVCVGYATTFRMFMNMLGMNCHIVHNDYHSWDLVELEDGQWYHVDVYSDVDSARYQNFNMTDATCRSGHEWDSSALPAADSVKYSYAVMNAEELADIYKIPKIIQKKITKKKSEALFYSFKKKLTDQQKEVLNVMLSQVSSLMETNGEEGYISANWYDDGKEGYILGINIRCWSEDETTNNGSSVLEKKDYKKIDQAINEAFGSSVNTYENYGMSNNTNYTDESEANEAA